VRCGISVSPAGQPPGPGPPPGYSKSSLAPDGSSVWFVVNPATLTPLVLFGSGQVFVPFQQLGNSRIMTSPCELNVPPLPFE
jgi:hypothetical protein